MKPTKLTLSIGGLILAFIALYFLSILTQHTLFPQEEKPNTDPLTIRYLQEQVYPGSDIRVEEILIAEGDFTKQIASYKSEELTIKALMTIPNEDPPPDGFPAIVIAHGDVNTNTYDRTEKYVGQVEQFASSGYVVFMPDYRGHADSQGSPTNAYAFPDYIVDTLNALASIRKHPKVDSENVGLWSHSTGGHIALRTMVVDPKVKAAVYWGGVVGSFEELLANWPTYWEYTNQNPPKPDPSNPQKDWRAYLTQKYGDPQKNPEGWDSISATSYLDVIEAPIQLHHAKTDEWVPFVLSEMLHKKLANAGKSSELISYEADNHNLENNNDLAMERTIDFFDRHLKEKTAER